MPGQATVTINGNQWTVSIASTYAELTTGLRGVASLSAGTGMLFILPSAQTVSVDTTGMNFPLDIIFIANNIVIDVARNIEPGYLVTEETPCDSFLEVNAGEAAGVEARDVVSVTAIQQAGIDLSTIISFAMPLAALGFVCAMVGGMARLAGSSSSGSEVRRLGRPRTEEKRARVHEEFYGTKELPPRGTGIGEREESAEGRRLGEPKTEAERRETHLVKYGSKELPERGKGLERHHSSYTDEELRAAINKMISEENPKEAFMSCCCFCGEFIPEEQRGDIKIWFEPWLGNIVWSCPKCDEWFATQKDPDLAAQLVLRKRAEKGGYLEGHSMWLTCGKKCRPLFEKAAVTYWGDDSGLAAQRQMEAQIALYKCQGIKPDMETAFGETERWFSFFSLWQSTRLIEQGKRDKALEILKDQKESYEEHRAFELGILQDYGATNTYELYSLTKYACDSLEGNRITEAIHYAQKAADLQYDLAVERAGTIAPSPVSRRESSKHHSMWLTLEQRKELEKKYGAIAVRWAEEATRAGDLKGVETAAEYYSKKMREIFGLGHLSPELSEEQLKKLRELLGLDAAEVLKIHQETGYIPC